ncbi:Uncharacterized protein Adt_16397 [Abeliophyllum distichum]|uniref:Late embryogenesis abundant protein LEA-2 subgroup domain-containing protein n=1 Tax=Abeliophyllum distichum TaxID=126358 RepID=A0ABD1TDI5_9LAMI
MSYSNLQNGDRVVVGIHVSTNESYVVSAVHVQSQYTTTSTVGRATLSTEVRSQPSRKVKSCVGAMSVSAFLLILLILILYFSFTNNPIFRLEYASISILNESGSNLTMARWNIGILTRNSNKRARFQYSDLDVGISQNNTEYIIRLKILGFNSTRKSETLLNATALAPFASSPDGSHVNIDVNLKGQVFFDNYFELHNHRIIKVLCNSVRIDFSDEGSMLRAPKKCTVKTIDLDD